MIIWSIVNIINSVLTLQVSTASLPHDRKPCEIKVVSNHTCSLHTCVCAGSRRVRVHLSGFRRQESVQLLGVSSSALFRSGSVLNKQKTFILSHPPPACYTLLYLFYSIGNCCWEAYCTLQWNEFLEVCTFSTVYSALKCIAPGLALHFSFFST